MTIDQAKTLLATCRTKTRRVELKISHGNSPIANITGRLHYFHEHKIWVVNGKNATACIRITDTVTINHTSVELKLSGRSVTYARALAHVPVADAMNAIVQEAEP